MPRLLIELRPQSLFRAQITNPFFFFFFPALSISLCNSFLSSLSLQPAPPPSLPPRCSSHHRVTSVGSLHLHFLHLHFVHSHFLHLFLCLSATVTPLFLQGKFSTCFPFVFRFVFIYFQFWLLQELICIGFEIVWSVLSNFVRELGLN